ncbi:efflux RND transporter periplasmic adaptor subunit [Sphingomonas sp. RB56-2]|uniref:Efflux RND transporter periplasmic adaptor subunit n=1 Tax=Sphingomonas brevis TaxID=2908206 RepID=A0ABT0S9P4_9SPHN|nr:efflux RND transporter periplasmic adaptor subunit [Sphingomonas brevis]MCL6741124.1 efflux RND transporter periplasmic adaptor subunit [Sphingomonas brevis]
MNRESSFANSDTLVVVDRSRRRRNVIIAAVAAIAILVAAFVLFSGKEKAPAGGDAAAVQVPTVTVVVPGRSEVSRVVTASGALAARHDQPVGVAGEGGMVRAVLVEAGAWVRQGQVLATVDRSVQSQNVAQLAAQVQVARADAALAQNEYERSEALVGRGFVSKADLDRKKAARDAANARIRVAEANLNSMRAQLGRLDIRAPKSGLILSRSVEVGQVVSPGSGALFRLAENGQMEMKAQLSQQDLAYIHDGMAAKITPIGTDRSFPGQVWQVSPTIDANSRQGEVRIAIAYDPSIRPGGFAEAKIESGTASAPQLPQSAVLSDDNGNYVYVINGKNEVERRSIKIGSVEDQGVTISEGITGSERVVLSAGPFLNPGQKVKPQLQAAR